MVLGVFSNTGLVTWYETVQKETNQSMSDEAKRSYN